MPYGDADALAAAVTDATAAVLLEPIQGEAGVVAAPGRLPRRRPPDRHRRTARCCGSTRCRPASAAPAAGSRTTHRSRRGRPSPTSADSSVARAWPAASRSAPAWRFGDAATLFEPGNHGTTFGGNPVACAAALAVIGTIEADGLLEHVTVLGQKLRDGLAADPRVTEVRGEGLLIGLDLATDASADVAAHALERGFIINNPTPGRIRLAPPLVLTEADADAFLAAWPGILDDALGSGERS